MPPDTLTSVHTFDFHRNRRHLFFSDQPTLTIGPYASCSIVLPTPTLYKGLLQIDKQHRISIFSDHKTFQENQCKERKQLCRPEDSCAIEQQGVMVTVKRSWQPFQCLVDNLIEMSSFTPELKQENHLKDWIKCFIPKEFLRVWDLDHIMQAFIEHRSGYGDIEPFMKDPSVTEILINGCESVYIESQGRLQALQTNMTHTRLDRLITKLIQKSGRTVNTKRPIVDCQLPSGERVNIILPPISKKGPLISIRKFREELTSLTELEQTQTFDQETHRILKSLIHHKKNILISGGTGCGKTTLLNALLSECNPEERIVIVEDTSELHPNHPHWLNLETRPPTQDPEAEITLSSLIKNTLRMRPSRIICGECRGPEAFQMLLAMNSGHPGSITTIHANSAKEAFYRLEIFLLMAGFDVPHRAIRQFIAASIDVVIQMHRTLDGSRKVASINEINNKMHLDDYALTTIV